MPDATHTDHRRAAFRAAAEAHFTYPPNTWRSTKLAERRWAITRPDGAVVDRFPTKKAANEALADGRAARIWHDHDAWYRETSTGPRNRPLEPWEREIIAEVTAAVEQAAPPAPVA